MSGFGSDEVECDDASGVSEVGHAGETREEAPEVAEETLREIGGTESVSPVVREREVGEEPGCKAIDLGEGIRDDRPPLGGEAVEKSSGLFRSIGVEDAPVFFLEATLRLVVEAGSETESAKVAPQMVNAGLFGGEWEDGVGGGPEAVGIVAHDDPRLSQPPVVKPLEERFVGELGLSAGGLPVENHERAVASHPHRDENSALALLAALLEIDSVGDHSHELAIGDRQLPSLIELVRNPADEAGYSAAGKSPLEESVCEFDSFSVWKAADGGKSERVCKLLAAAVAVGKDGDLALRAADARDPQRSQIADPGVEHLAETVSRAAHPAPAARMGWPLHDVVPGFLEKILHHLSNREHKFPAEFLPGLIEKLR